MFLTGADATHDGLLNELALAIGKRERTVVADLNEGASAFNDVDTLIASVGIEAFVSFEGLGLQMRLGDAPVFAALGVPLVTLLLEPPYYYPRMLLEPRTDVAAAWFTHAQAIQARQLSLGSMTRVGLTPWAIPCSDNRGPIHEPRFDYVVRANYTPAEEFALVSAPLEAGIQVVTTELRKRLVEPGTDALVEFDSLWDRYGVPHVAATDKRTYPILVALQEFARHERLLQWLIALPGASKVAMIGSGWEKLDSSVPVKADVQVFNVTSAVDTCDVIESARCYLDLDTAPTFLVARDLELARAAGRQTQSSLPRDGTVSPSAFFEELRYVTDATRVVRSFREVTSKKAGP